METTFEIYLRKKGETRWNLQDQYGDGEQTRAIEGAKRLETQQFVDAVRVVREIFYPDTNETKEFVVYTSKKKKPGDGPAPDHSQSGGADADEEKAKPKKKSRGKAAAETPAAEAAPAADAAPATPEAAAAAAAKPKKVRRGGSVILKIAIILVVSLVFSALFTVGFIAIIL